MLLNSDFLVVGVAAGTILPHLAARDRRLMGDKVDLDDTAEISRLRATVRQWRIEAARQGKALQLPVMPFLLRNIWTGALVFFSLLMFSTFFISTVFQASLPLITPKRICSYTVIRPQYSSALWVFVGQWLCGCHSQSLWK